jgi:beta-lactamase superfamily II metal-dependent hydrolase
MRIYDIAFYAAGFFILGVLGASSGLNLSTIVMATILTAAAPKIAVIEVGKNSYGHPTAEVLNRSTSIGSQVFRTDKNETVKLVINNQEINIFKKKY